MLGPIFEFDLDTVKKKKKKKKKTVYSIFNLKFFVKIKRIITIYIFHLYGL
jgi:hypothetical protein